MDGRVDHKGGRIEQADLAALDNLALLIDANQIRGLDEGKGDAKGVDPEGVGLDGVAKSNVAGDTLVETVLGGVR